MLDRLLILISLLIPLLAGLLQPAPEQTSPLLSDLQWASATNGLGPVERNQTNGDEAASDGEPIRLDGLSYDSGLGVSTESEIAFNLGGRCARLVGDSSACKTGCDFGCR